MAAAGLQSLDAEVQAVYWSVSQAMVNPGRSYRESPTAEGRPLQNSTSAYKLGQLGKGSK